MAALTRVQVKVCVEAVPRPIDIRIGNHGSCRGRRHVFTSSRFPSAAVASCLHYPNAGCRVVRHRAPA